MSERGVFAVDRGVFDHPKLDYGRAPYSRREAWIWLISEASWKPRSIAISGRVIRLQRGQLGHSTRFIADKWRWPQTNVRRFLTLLKTDAMIGAETGSGISVITICNYDEYQRVSLPTGSVSGSQTGSRMAHDRLKEKDIEGIESPSLRDGAELPLGDKQARKQNGRHPPAATYTDDRHELFHEGRLALVSLGVNEKQAGSMIGKWLRDAGDDCRMVMDAIRAAEKARVMDPIPWITKSFIARVRAPAGRNGFLAVLEELTAQEKRR